MKNVFVCFFICGLLNSGFAQSKIYYLKVIDTVFLNGFIIYENKSDNVYLLNINEIKPEYKEFKEVREMYKQASGKILVPSLINSPYIYDSLEVVLKRDTVLCKETIDYDYIIKNSRVVFKDESRIISVFKMSGLFYRLLVLDKYLFSKKKKIKYNSYLAFYCYDYHDRKFIITPDKK